MNRIFLILLAFAVLLCCAGCQSIVAGGEIQGNLVINEVVTSNSFSLSQEALGSPDWIELYNGTGAELDFSGYGLSDNLKDPHKWTFPQGSKLPAGGYLLVYCAKSSLEVSGLLCTGFGLSKSGESLYLTDAYYNIVQQLDIPALLSDVSYARDDAGTYGYCASPTPGQQNADIVYSSAAESITAGANGNLQITECMPRGGCYQAADGGEYPWAELYNAGTEAVLLSDYYLSDTMHQAAKWRMPGSTLAPGEYAVVWFSGDEDLDGLHAAFKLGAADDAICLSDGAGNIVSMLNWPEDIPQGVSVLPGGAYTAAATPGAANGNAAQFTSLAFSQMDASFPVRLNEVLLHNEYSLRDDTGEREAWAELYNSSAQMVSLAGYYLSDDPGDPFKWAFPAETQIDPESYLIVFLSGKQSEGALHSSFRLSGSDAALLLTDVAGMGREQIDLPANLGENVSIGPTADGALGYFTSPTPGGANTTHAFAEPAGAGYTDMAGVYISEVSAITAAKSGKADWIELHNASAGDVDLSGWRITDDPDFPAKCTLASLTIPAGGYVAISASSSSSKGATAPFGISPTGETLILSDSDGNIRDIFQTGALRLGVSAGRSSASTARVFFTSATKGEANPQSSYSAFAASPVFSEMALYHSASFSLSISCPNADASIHYTLDGSEPSAASPSYTVPLAIEKSTVIRAVAFVDGLLQSDVATATYLFEKPHSLPVVCLSAQSDDWSAMYSVTERTQRVEKEAHFAFYETDGLLGTSFGCSLRASGSSTLTARQKSMAVYLRGAYGQSETSYPFFDESDVTTFSSLVLRNSGQDRSKARLRDSFFSKVVKGLRMEYAETRLVVVYVNGQYWGIYDLNENQNEDYMATHYGVDPDAVDIIRRNIQALAGRNSDNKRVRAYAQSTDLSSNAKYAEYIQWVDPDYISDYLIAQTFFANGDMFNQKYWRSQDYTVRWRPVYYDLDYALSASSPTRNILPSYFNPAGIPSQDGSLTNMDLYVGLRKNKGWCEAFGERYVYVVRNYFNPERTTAILDEMAAQLREELPRHIQRWGELRSMSAWESEIASLRKCLQERPEYALKYLQKEFGFSDAQMAAWEAKALKTS
ncbi:MAG: lamin tail domain-containing protein [Candidatus Pelethousia sp.]|nr:lamin tail domain-containing protein [Candidatus Pelethousia sp.]